MSIKSWEKFAKQVRGRGSTVDPSKWHIVIEKNADREAMPTAPLERSVLYRLPAR